MLSGKDIKLSLVLLLIIVLLPIAGCNTDKFPTRTTTPYTGPPIQYSTFELGATDIRLKYFQHPLYRLEYPSIFNLVDMNLADIPHIYGDMTMVYFTVQQTGIPYQKISIIVEEPMEGYYHDAAGKLELRLTQISHANTISTKKTEVLGIPAYYLEAYFIYENPPFYSAYKVLSRSVFLIMKV